MHVNHELPFDGALEVSRVTETRTWDYSYDKNNAKNGEILLSSDSGDLLNLILNFHSNANSGEFHTEGFALLSDNDTESSIIQRSEISGTFYGLFPVDN